MDILDTRDLIEERESNKQDILDGLNHMFSTELDSYEDIEAYLEDEASKHMASEERDEFYENWEDEYNQIREVDELESNIYSDEFKFGVILINEDSWEDYVKKFLEDCGYISKDFPRWIEIDWEATANNVSQDYGQVEFRGETYSYRA